MFVRRLVALAAFASAFTLQACGGTGDPPAEDSGVDSSADADAVVLCSTDVDCSDGVFCNGEELCAPDDPEADALGCLDAAGDACEAPETCDEAADSCSSGGTDADGDGHDAIEFGGDDCDDADPNRFPGNPEVCDSTDHDEDCEPRTFGFRDTDGDGAGDGLCCNVDPESMERFCGDDCDDGRPTVSPTNTETCDTLDNDCDGMVDETVLETFYVDADEDGFGSAAAGAATTMACSVPTGFSDVATDCNDDDNAVNPGLSDTCDEVDNDCDMVVDEDASTTPYYLDADADGFGLLGDVVEACAPVAGRVSNDTDCDDGDPALHPGAAEDCDGVDNDCDTDIDEAVRTLYYRDSDNDGYGDPDGVTVLTCARPVGFAANNTDCDDDFAGTHPGLAEVCDTRDNDCDFGIDEGDGVLTVFYRDADGDTFGDPDAPTTLACTVPSGFSANNTDCDDLEEASHPGGTEVCDVADNDCDTRVDESTSVVPWYADIDGDGFGDPTVAAIDSCAPIAGRVTRGTDCDDDDPGSNPGNPEVCDLKDNDCDTRIDEGGVLSTFYLDADSDSFGTAATSVEACSAPANHVANSGDCNDSDNSISPLGTEDCDSVDNDCDTLIDESGSATYYRDGDDDGQGTTGAPLPSMSCTAPAGFTVVAGDCNDSDDTIFFGAPELCDRKDNDCSASGGADATEDGDGDGHSPIGASCSGGFPRDDCDDGAGTVFAGAPELCDRLDNDCSSGGGADTTEDSDGDGHAPTGASCSGGLPRDDCNDSEVTVFAGAAELCDRLDNNCSSGGGVLIAEDADGDGHSSPTASCSGGFARDDCNDSAPTIFTTASELCDRLDNDCSDGGGADMTEDVDGDGFSAVAASCNGGFPRTDCVDTDPAINPDQVDACNSVDDDCDMAVDEATSADAWCGALATCSVEGCRYDEELSAGDRSSCAVLATGGVKCWGNNLSGQLGDGTTMLAFNAVDVVGISSAVAVDIDDRHSCALLSGGTIECWGGGGAGLGDGTGMSSPTPVVVSGITNAVSIGTGRDRTCAVLATGEARCWGVDELGDGGGGSNTPVAVTGITDATQIAVTASRSCVRHATGAVSCWGQHGLKDDMGVSVFPVPSDATPVAIAGISDAVYVATGGVRSGSDNWSHTCVVHQDGTVSCWGENGSGELGDGTTIDRAAPVLVPGLSDIVRVTAGQDHTCALQRGGQVSCWGDNSTGQASQSMGGVSFAPEAMTSIADAELVSAGASHSCARVTSGEVRCWGSDGFDALGGSPPRYKSSVTGITDAVQLSANGDSTCALLSGGTVSCWGDNGRGQLGRGSTEVSNVPAPVSGITTATDVSVGDFSACAVLADGTARCWGWNGASNLGDGTTVTRTSPVPVMGLSSAAYIAAGQQHTCAAHLDGTVECLGDNFDGSLGDGTTVSSSSLVSVLSLTGVDELVAGRGTSCTRVGGTVRCWGIGSVGQLGNGAFGRSLTVVTAVGLSDAVDLGMGESHVCALRTGGAVSCWGNNNDGQLGQGTTSPNHTPTPVTGLTDAIHVDGGTDHTCAVRTGGTVQCWGSSRDRRLGIGPVDWPFRETTPVTVPDVSDASTVAIGDHHSCALLATGAVTCWGEQALGQLGGPIEPSIVSGIP